MREALFSERKEKLAAYESTLAEQVAAVETTLEAALEADIQALKVGVHTSQRTHMMHLLVFNE